MSDDEEIIRAWQNMPFKPCPTDAELSLAFGIREGFRARGFDLRLGADGSVLVANLMGGRHTAPPALLDRLWANVEAIGALMEEEEKERAMRAAMLTEGKRRACARGERK